MSRIRILVETDETNPTFDWCHDNDVAAESTYWDWLRPLFNVILPGAKIVELEIEGTEGNYLPWDES